MNNNKMKTGIVKGRVEKKNEIRIPLGETNVIQEYLDGWAIADLARKYGCSDTNVGQYLRYHGVETNGQRLKTETPYTLNEHWLDELDCEEKYYFVGMFYADGTNSADRNQVRVKLEENDKYLLELFQSWFESDRPLQFNLYDPGGRKPERTWEFNVTSKYLCNRMTELGCPPVKSTITKFPTWVPDDMMPHFIRGVYDGDGSISLFGNNKNGQPRANITIVNSIDFVDGLHKYITETLNIRANINDYGGDQVYKSVQIEKAHDVKKFLDWMYKDATVFMTRKHDSYIEYITKRDFSKETSYDKRDRIRANAEMIIQRYNNGESMTAIGKSYDCSIGVISRLLKSNGIEIRKNTTPHQRAKLEREKNKNN